MKIVTVKNSKRMLGALMAISVSTSFMNIPPYKTEDSYELQSFSKKEENGFSRKRTKKKSNNIEASFYRNSRNNNGKPNYF